MNSSSSSSSSSSNINRSNSEDRLTLFHNMIKDDYLGIHGNDVICKLFERLNNEQLNKLIELYNEYPLLRWRKCKGYLEKEGLISRDLDDGFVVHMYINALQHFLEY